MLPQGFNFSGVTAATAILPPGTISAANNGLSANPAGTAVLGQDVGQVGNPAQLLNAREIPALSFMLSILGQTTANGVNRFQFEEGSLLQIFGDTFNGPGFPAPAVVLNDIANPGTFAEFSQLLDAGSLLPLTVLRNAQVGIYLTSLGQVAITPNVYAPLVPANIAFDVIGDSRFLGALGARKFVDTATASPVPVRQDLPRSQYGNYNAGLKIFDLPAAQVGLNFGFYVGHVDGVSINPTGAETIRIGATLGAAGANAVSTTVGDYIELSCINGGEWVTTSLVGAGWTV